MRAMLAVVIVMGVLIVAGVATLAITVVHRLSSAPMQAALVLEEPTGTHMQAITTAGDKLALLLQGGGPDRILLLDTRSGQVVGRVGLAR
ncbi:DUF6476 family protein [Acidisphaera sp. L21]|uniref:DUF6476 family protein n=1 Tax=Acidisphaera sp. L21 TaxID=1641851 RepID=UPI0020B15DB5|nr:DUF6476 family protein [Acidisphaera sp. L21]